MHGAPLSRHQAVSWGGALGLLVVATVAVAGGWGGDRTTVAVADGTSLAASALASALLVRAARRPGPARAAWRWLAVGAALWTVGEVIWTWIEVVQHREVPFPSVADIAYLGATPFLVVGVMSFARDRSGWFQLRNLVDSLLVAASALFVTWALVLGPVWRADNGGIAATVVSVAYPVTDLVLAVLAIVVVRRSATTHRRPLLWVAGSLLLMGFVDSAFTWMINQGTYSAQHPIVMLWPAAYLLLAFSTTQTGVERLPDDAPEPLSAVLAPYVPLLAAAAVAAPRLAGDDALGPFLTLVGALAVVLVLVRQVLTTWDLRTTVAALRAREVELHRMAHEDPLTGVANRARLTHRLEHLMTVPGAMPAVVYIDLDGFKEVNDRFGHATGDQLLIEVSERLLACTDERMLLARLGGDEFVVLVEQGHEPAREVAQCILRSFDRPFHHQGEEIPFRASLGIASAPAGGSPEEAVRRADAAMYAAKSNGKGHAVDYPDGTLDARVIATD
ncbi:MAG: diguanylate cyclase domain-containing protein [Actinomycetota bacterium]